MPKAKAAKPKGLTFEKIVKSATPPPNAGQHPNEVWHKPFSYKAANGKVIEVKGHWETKAGHPAKPKPPKAPKLSRKAEAKKAKLRAKSSPQYESRAATYLLGAATQLTAGEDDRKVERFLRGNPGVNVSVRRGEGWVEFGFQREHLPEPDMKGAETAAARFLEKLKAAQRPVAVPPAVTTTE